MRNQTRDAVGRVLREAARAKHFFDLSDAERLNWMIARAFELGCRSRRAAADRLRAAPPPNDHLAAAKALGRPLQ